MKPLRYRLSTLRLATLLFLAFVTLFAVGFAQDGKGKNSKKKDEEQASKALTEDQKTEITEFFKASSAKYLEDGRLELAYRFSLKSEEMADDWMPDIMKLKNVRWSVGYELSSIVIADSGRWLHIAEWDPNVSMEVAYDPQISSRKGDLVAAVFSWAKMKRAVGSNGGVQVVRLSGVKIAGAIPKAGPIFQYAARTRFGYELKDGVFYATRNGSRTADTSKSKSFLKKLGPGHAGLTWRGSVSGNIRDVTITGRLSEAYVKKILGKS